MTIFKCPDLYVSSESLEKSLGPISDWTDFRYLDQHPDFARIGRGSQRPTFQLGGGGDRIQVGTQFGHGGGWVRLCSLFA